MRPRKPRPRWTTYAAVVVVAALTLWSARGVEFTLEPLLANYDRGVDVLRRFLHPDWAFVWASWPAWAETLQVAVLAATVGCAIALVLALLASQVTASPWVYRTVKIVLAVQRSLPDVAWALLAVAVVGVGPLAGLLALVAFNIGVAAKLTAESIDAVDPGPVEAARAVGADPVQRATTAVVPQVMPNFLSYCFYVFELNIRASLVLGAVGAGGIGTVIIVQTSRFQFENVAGIIYVFVLVVFVLDQLSRWLRRRLI
ncbi:phosphonate ABC transporter, inner membrane subunit [Beutenbergia cavernae DSM 12333]|uniref:Phosphonate ABC transporter, inner membrane subunit n=1 Tax=Beutenbergia cavernae (strain ATCC BAA-8 / DSM 12333 / CCUG 43141 / JCM 11478 / NBRC 16432 / NCIMB 13614 / HKI 0122) TaxID=471853 RepID=C5BXN8_BEUC1|nr:phosphonate ABC transporter, inner membrane subunit [Beutenbergia cavernae DSM 12333]